MTAPSSIIFALLAPYHSPPHLSSLPFPWSRFLSSLPQTEESEDDVVDSDFDVSEEAKEEEDEEELLEPKKKRKQWIKPVKTPRVCCQCMILSEILAACSVVLAAIK